MPLYEDLCTACGHLQEEIRRVSDPAPTHCGQPMERQLGTAMLGHRTRGGNDIYSAATSTTTKGNRKPKTIGRGHGLGGRRKNPSMSQIMSTRVGVQKP